MSRLSEVDSAELLALVEDDIATNLLPEFSAVRELPPLCPSSGDFSIYPPIWRSTAESPQPKTPPRGSPKELVPPPAPVRPRKAVEDPDDPIHCPLHASRSFLSGAPVLGYSRNSMGDYGMYAPSGNGHCHICQKDQHEEQCISDMWDALSYAEKQPTLDTIRKVEVAVERFRAEGYEHRYNDGYEVTQALEQLRTKMKNEDISFFS